MPPTLQSDGVEATHSADEQFLDLLLADEDLLRAEFDGIIAAEWPGPPRDRPSRGVRAEQQPGETRRRVRAAGPPGRPRHPRTGGWPRQRSPPAAHTREGPTGQTKRGR